MQQTRLTNKDLNMPGTTAILAFCLLILGSSGADAAWVGKASYYELKGRTASGSHVGSLTAAHRTLPFGSKVRVTNLRNNRSVILTVNDRGPFTGGRVIDVSGHAADILGFRAAGVARVKVEPLSDVAGPQ